LARDILARKVLIHPRLPPLAEDAGGCELASSGAGSGWASAIFRIASGVDFPLAELRPTISFAASA
jgi:hypothetical protein